MTRKAEVHIESNLGCGNAKAAYRALVIEDPVHRLVVQAMMPQLCVPLFRRRRKRGGWRDGRVGRGHRGRTRWNLGAEIGIQRWIR